MDPSTLNHWWSLLALACYGLTTGFLYRELERSDGRAARHTWTLLLVGAASHGFLLAGSLFAGATILVGLDTALSFVAWVVVVLFLLALIREPLATLGLLVVPFAMIVVALDWSWNGPPVPLAHLGGTAIAHTLISVVAFGLLALSFCQAVVLLLQEWHLQNKRGGSFFHSLPALLTMEGILFQLIGLGFALLTVALISGTVFANQIFGQPLLFNHHVVLSIVAWIAFGTLLAGRVVFGWRGRVAVVWTIVSFGLLTLAYFGTRVVLEIVLDRR